MMLNQNLKLALEQKLALTPEMTQSLKILQMNRSSLDQLADDYLKTNPALELSEAYFTDYKRHRQRSAGVMETDVIGNVVDDHANRDFKDTLKLQMTLVNGLPQNDVKTMSLMIDHMDNEGFLKYSKDQLSELLEVVPSEVDRLKEQLQTLGIRGVGAQDRVECLKLQCEDPLAYKVLDGHLSSLAMEDYETIAKAMGVDESTVEAAVDYIKQLSLKPMVTSVKNEMTSYLIPDVRVTVEDGVIGLELLRSKSGYLVVSDNFKGKDKKAYRSFYGKHYSDAKSLIRAIQQREKTLHRVMTYLVNKQSAFFLEGKLHLTSMSMKEVGKALNLNTSTISRALRDKAIECPQGTYEAKHFFSNKLSSRHPGGSNKDARILIKRLIGDEDKKSPLSDSKIEAALAVEGIIISRRTVAKYRQQLGIPSVIKRRHRKR